MLPHVNFRLLLCFLACRVTFSRNSPPLLLVVVFALVILLFHWVIIDAHIDKVFFAPPPLSFLLGISSLYLQYSKKKNSERGKEGVVAGGERALELLKGSR